MQLSFEKSFMLDTDYRTPKHFIVVGAGGNGGYYIPNLARQVSIQNQLREIERLPAHKITLIDADNVELKNLNRQNFINRDINENKARVLADRYGRAFGLEIDFLDEYLVSVEMLHGIIRNYRQHRVVIVGAVDNNKTRKILHDTHKLTPRSFYLDAGNEEHAGQVVCGYFTGNANPSKPSPTGGTIQHFDLPSICEKYPEVMEAKDKLPTELSCAEQSESAPQNIFTNQTAATLLMGFTNTILTAKAQDGYGLKIHEIIFDAENVNFTTKFNKLSVLYPVAPEAVAEVVAEPKAVKKKAAPKKKPVEVEGPVEGIVEAPLPF